VIDFKDMLYCFIYKYNMNKDGLYILKMIYVMNPDNVQSKKNLAELVDVGNNLICSLQKNGFLNCWDNKLLFNRKMKFKPNYKPKGISVGYDIFCVLSVLDQLYC